MDAMKKLMQTLDRYKIPLLVLALGVLLMLIPFDASSEDSDSDRKFEKLLSETRGVGKVSVIISDTGVVVVCEGADSARVRLDIVNSIESYTGFGPEKVTILQQK